MNSLPLDTAHAGLSRSPSFTLGTALAWLGHDCSGQCPDEATTARGTVWFVRLPQNTQAAWTTTLVEVDFASRPWSDEHTGLLIRAVNGCTHRDHIRVRESSTL